jgi:hypothetical protein
MTQPRPRQVARRAVRHANTRAKWREVGRGLRQVARHAVRHANTRAKWRLVGGWG